MKANYVTMLREGCPNSKAPPDAANKYSFVSHFLEDALLLFFVASHILRVSVSLKKKKEKMATLHGGDRHFHGLGERNHDVRVKHLVTQPGNAPKTLNMMNV